MKFSLEVMVHCRYIIEGYTEDGRKFRPSDWIDRIASMMASYGSSHRLVFSELLHPELYQGQKCLIIDTQLEDVNPGMFEYVMDFVKNNKLKMTQVCEEMESELGS
ncbi:DUF3579 domain-containing protein [Hydrogenovibrio marinus]|uniref:DUF3579 domain-containing protein n=1 Tax=Hydrogenovibrio marinus TaxID=28885 RepID=UPI000692062A|nr:DUF3579 domain-containing protein [Hydrogenovibrio marinus]BBN59854.1 hypothetical protein HVMH_1448 [Hydrogenovibrio marinus]